MLRKDNILIVDDVPNNIQVAMSILKEENCNLFYAVDGVKALELIEQNEFDLVLLDIMMPVMNGLQVCRKIRENSALKDLPIIFLTAKTDIDSITEGFEAGGMDYITKPFHANELLVRVKTHLDLYKAKKILANANLALENKLSFNRARLLGELEENQKDMLQILMRIMEATSDETSGHMRRVAEYTKLLAKHHPVISNDDVETLYLASLLHDIGKIVMPMEILHKPGKLSDDEFSLIKTHADEGKAILNISQRKLIKTAQIIVYQHHERWDGAGYPNGLKENEIHIYGRIVCLADTFDALSHKRSYKEAWKLEDVFSYIESQKSLQFDPELVEIMLEHKDDFSALHNGICQN